MENQAPDISLSPQKPRPNFMVWIAVGVVTLAIGIGVGLVLGKYSSLPIPSTISVSTPLPTEIPVKEADLTANWKTYTSTKIQESSYMAFSIKYPPSWGESIDYLEPDEVRSGFFALRLSKNGYTISITQAPTDGSSCLFDNDPDYAGPAFRPETYIDINSSIGLFRRVKREFPNMFYLCQDYRSITGYFGEPTKIGDIVYRVPSNSSNQALEEMDDIIKTIEAR